MCYIITENIMLGNRSVCWGGIILDGSFEVVEKTDGALKNDLKQGKKVLGIKLTADGNLELDKEKYFMQDVMEHRHAGSWKPKYKTENMINKYFYVVGVTDKNGSTLFNCINSKMGRCQMDENKLKVYYEMGAIAGGVKIENNEIIVSDLIKPVEKRFEPVVEVEVKPAVVETKMETSKVEETKSEKSKVIEGEVIKVPPIIKKIENPLDDKIVSVEIEKVAKPKASSTKAEKSKK